jgi:hypothetical protein
LFADLALKTNVFREQDFQRCEFGTSSMLFVVEILDKPDPCGIARVIEQRLHTAVDVTEALRTARANLRSLPPRAFGFCLKADGRELGRWQIAQERGGAEGSKETNSADEASGAAHSRIRKIAL